MGYLFAGLGVVIFLASLAVDTLGFGDRRLGASQILGMEIGVLFIAAGILTVLYFQDRKINVSGVFRDILDRLANLPAGVWIMAGFLVVYLFFFLQPVFLNPEQAMFYFNRFLPDKRPIGLDIRAVMDFIRNWLAAGQSPYADGFIAYPPLSLILFSPLLLIDYPGYYYFITAATLVFFLISTLLIPLIRAGGVNKYLPVILFVPGLFSYGFQFELERGQSNIIAFSLCLIAVHLFHLHQKHRLPAYLLFTLGVQIKIYPAILILLFVENWRDWKGNLKRIAGILSANAALLFISGPRVFVEFLQAVRGQQAYGPTWNGNHSLNGFVNHLAFDGLGLFGPEAVVFFQENFRLVELGFLAVIGLCLSGVFFRLQSQASAGLDPALLVLCTICGLVIPSISNDYKLPILIAPMALFWSSLSRPVGGVGKKISYGLLMLTTSLAYWSTQYPFVVKPYFLTRNFPALFVLLLAVTLISFMSSPRVDGTESPGENQRLRSNE
jgi:hypothetical protein